LTEDAERNPATDGAVRTAFLTHRNSLQHAAVAGALRRDLFECEHVGSRAAKPATGWRIAGHDPPGVRGASDEALTQLEWGQAEPAGRAARISASVICEPSRGSSSSAALPQSVRLALARRGRSGCPSNVTTGSKVMSAPAMCRPLGAPPACAGQAASVDEPDD
jgi:hypothetical protein